MSIIRVSKNKDNPYVMVDKRPLGDDSLSWKAKGILAYLLSMPNDWKFYTEEVETHAIDGITALRSGLKELENAGYITKEQTRDADGKITGYEWVVHEMPSLNRARLRKSIYGKPASGKPNATNNELTNNEATNKLSPHKEMVRALMEATELDMNIKLNSGRIYKASKQLREAGYTPDDVRDFMLKWKQDWRYKRDHKPPAITVIQAEIKKAINVDELVLERKRLAEQQIARANGKEN